jgi:hypothetical protein
MFPIEFPLGILKRAKKDDLILDPFCGRGTTNFAARLCGLSSVGVDSSPVAAAITAAKLVDVTPEDIAAEASLILQGPKAARVPEGDFWQWAFHRTTLSELCQFREAFLEDCSRPAAVALRGVILGALHGPRQKFTQSYFSNQCPRTYAPKPGYAVRFWRDHNLLPVAVDSLALISQRARRFYGRPMPAAGEARLADSRVSDSIRLGNKRYAWTVTSPPYYGMRTYLPDQWLRNWFVGGSDRVDYGQEKQLLHRSPELFADELRKVWTNVRSVSTATARLVIRFGGINDRRAKPEEILKYSLSGAWQLQTIKSAGAASDGRRQADSFLRRRSQPVDEFVAWAIPA